VETLLLMFKRSDFPETAKAGYFFTFTNFITLA
jgi:hypothetical protein